MKKRRLFKIMLLAGFIIGTSGAFTSCKDYDGDSKWKEKVSVNESLIEALNQQVESLKVAQNKCRLTCDSSKIRLNALEDLANGKADTTSVNKLKQTIDGNTRRIGVLEGQAATAITENAKLNDSIAALRRDLNADKADLAALTEKVDKNEGNISDLKDSIAALRRDINTNTSNIAALTQKVEANEESISTINGQITAINDSIAADEEKLRLLTNRVTVNEGDITTLKSQVIDLNKADSLLQVAIDNANDSINSVKNALATLSGTVAQNADSIAVLRARLASCINNCSQTALKVSGLINTVDSLGNAVNDTISSMKSATAALQSAVIGLQDDVATLFAKAYRDSILTKHVDSLAHQADSLAKDNLARIASLETNYTNLKDSVNSLGSILGTVKDLAEANETAIKELTPRVEALETAVNKIENALRKQVTGINVNGTYNPIYGYYAMPTGDVRSSVLAAYYGRLSSSVEFPTARAAYYTNPEAGKLTNGDLEVLGITPEQIPAGTIVTEGGQAGNAGTMWLTLNPTNVDLEGKEFTLVNSRGENSKLTLTRAESSNDLLSFGYTRAANANGFYKVRGTVTADAVDALKPNLNMEEIKDEVRSLYRAWTNRTANGGVKVNFSELAGVIYSNINDIVPALALKTTWTDNNDSAHSVLSQYSVAATAVKPLSFGTLQGRTFSPLPIYTAYEDINVNIDTIKINGVEKGNYTVTVENADGTTSTYTVDGLNELVDQLNASLIGVQSDINGQIKDIDNEIDKVEKVTKVFKTYNRWANRVNGWFSRDGNNNINRSLQPVLFVGRGSGLAKLGNAKYGTLAVPSGSSLLATTYTYELLAPAYKKWIAVTNVWQNSNDAIANVRGAQNGNNSCLKALADANSGENMKTVIYGTKRHVTLGTLKSGYVYEIAYSAVDYMGKVVVRKFYVRGK